MMVVEAEGLALALSVAQAGICMLWTCAFRIAPAWEKATWEESEGSKVRGWGKRLGADQNRDPVDVVASSGKVYTS